MTNNEKLEKGLKYAAGGYLFLYFDINLFGFNLLPSFVGYIFFLNAVRLLKGEERDLSLLEGLGKLLIGWYLIQWAAGIFDIEINWQFLSLIVFAMYLYFHFQFLTNVASIAEKYQKENSWKSHILQYRTAQTLILTGAAILENAISYWKPEIWKYISFGMALVYVIIGLCVIKALLELASSVK